MAPATAKADGVPGIAANQSATQELSAGRKGKKRLAADTPNSVDDNSKRLRSIDHGTPQVEAKDSTPARISYTDGQDVITKRKQAHDFVKQAMKAVTTAKDDAGRQMSLEFRHLPDRNLFIDYYEVIRLPVSLDTIRAKSSHFDKFIKQYEKTKDPEAKKALLQQEYEGYADWKAAEHDFDMMWRNAKRYNVKGAQIYEDAQKLHKLTKTLSEEFARRLSGEEEQLPLSSSGSSVIRVPSTVYKQVKQGMKMIEAAKSLEGDRSAAEFFHELPDETQYADYYQLIQQPISLAEINTKMQQRAYTDIDQWIRDVTLMCHNAMQYNIEGSLVYRDAEAIKNELKRVVQAYQEALGEEGTDQPASTAASTPVPGSSSGTKIKLNLSGMKEARPSVQSATRPSKDRIIRLKRPSLPEKTVSREIVASLPQFDESEKATWAATLTAKQTEELLHLLKEQEDPTRPITSGRIVNDAPQNPPAVQSSLPTQPTAGSQPTPQAPAANVSLHTAQAHVPERTPISAGAHVPLPSPSTSVSQPSIPPPLQKQGQTAIPPSSVPAVQQPPPPPVTSPAVPASRSALSSLYASISIPAPIPMPANHWESIFRPKQPAHHLPLIRYFSFTYDFGMPKPDQPSAQSRTEWQNTIKLKNMRGITSHIVAISRTTRNVEITAYLEEGYYKLDPLALNGRFEPIGHQESAIIHDTLSYAPLPELSLECNGKTPKGELVHPGGIVSKRPIAHKWSVSVDPAIVNFVIEVHVKRAAEQSDGTKNPTRGEVKETCMIFVNRQ